MQRRREGVHVLGPADVPAALRCLERDPVVNVFAEYRTRLTRLDPQWLGGQAWGWYVDGELRSMCHAAANLVPVNCDDEASAAFARRAAQTRSTSATLVGPRHAVEAMWRGLAPAWATPRECRWDQPHLQIAGTPALAPDPLVRRTEPGELEVVYPACVAMYTEEVGVSPEVDGGGPLYRTRVRQLISRGWSFVRIENGRVVFKAEVACATPAAAQIQGVYVDPARRGEGIAAAGMAAVVQIVLAEIAPAASLYVNAHNTPARKAYARCGFEQSETFSTLMF